MALTSSHEIGTNLRFFNERVELAAICDRGSTRRCAVDQGNRASVGDWEADYDELYTAIGVTGLPESRATPATKGAASP
ncbi:MAG: hypothetical protein ABEL97_07175 [Salinibacter sp.]